MLKIVNQFAYLNHNEKTTESRGVSSSRYIIDQRNFWLLCWSSIQDKNFILILFCSGSYDGAWNLEKRALTIRCHSMNGTCHTFSTHELHSRPTQFVYKSAWVCVKISSWMFISCLWNCLVYIHKIRSHCSHSIFLLTFPIRLFYIKSGQIKHLPHPNVLASHFFFVLSS